MLNIVHKVNRYIQWRKYDFFFRGRSTKFLSVYRVLGKKVFDVHFFFYIDFFFVLI